MRAVQRTRACGGPSARTVLLVLTMLVVRALVPAGYMLATDEGHARIVLCDAGIARFHHEGHHHPGGGHTHGDPTCPYAQSAGPAPPPVLPVVDATAAAAYYLLPASLAQLATPFGPARRNSPRAPPVRA
jgi:hypothetical protein